MTLPPSFDLHNPGKRISAECSVVEADMPDGETVWYIMPARHLSRPPSEPPHLCEPEFASLLETAGKDFVTERQALAYIEGVHGRVVSRHRVRVAAVLDLEG